MSGRIVDSFFIFGVVDRTDFVGNNFAEVWLKTNYAFSYSFYQRQEKKCTSRVPNIQFIFKLL